MKYTTLIFALTFLYYAPLRAVETEDSPPWDLIQEDLWAVDQDIPAFESFDENEGLNI